MKHVIHSLKNKQFKISHNIVMFGKKYVFLKLNGYVKKKYNRTFVYKI